MATFMERLSFLQKVPTLMKATADDEKPCPGYLFEEIGKISQESTGCGQCLLEYLLERLQVESCHVKIKVLKVFVHLCGHGSPHFLTELRRNSTFIQQASVYSGPLDPIHGTAMYQKVRATAQELARLLFTETVSHQSSTSPCKLTMANMGMGSESAHGSRMQGFGYSPVKNITSGETLMDKIRKATEFVASAVLPPMEHQGIRLHDNHYRAVVAPSGPVEVAVPACAYTVPPHRPKVSQRCPGQVGGGWEEIDSSHSSSHNSCQENADHCQVSGGGSSNSGGTSSQSGASRESSGDLSERVEAMQLGDCGQEMALISRMTEGSKVFLSREENQHFIKECSTLNCEVVVELLSRRLQDPSQTAQMRALCAVACLMTSDLLSLEQIFGVTQRRLVQLSEGPPGPVANKTIKILRQFKALMGGPIIGAGCDAAAANGVPLSSSDQPPTATSPALLLPTRPGDIPVFNHHRGRDPETEQSPGGQAQPPPLPDLGWAQRGTSERLLNLKLDDERGSANQGEEFVDSQIGFRTGETQLTSNVTVKDSELQTERDPFRVTDPQIEQPCGGRLSLFSGMELVTRGRSVCPSTLTERSGDLQPQVEKRDGRERLSVTPTNTPLLCVDNISDTTPTYDLTSTSSQSASAFSFLNL
ncbi:AP-4 complex accessory subunit Tepsin-like isoform X1 [Salvelinus namaycush]|uniref:AP-4 complex accessory subunit Tepsin-like isoform X1 n=1 Tax=Salvelinus namaycush TaxID=8040 RepID=A0A8U0QQS8_SALNM|nr:AP-4 complex accessory subunit Tepsin-like isoform X1 [Salvelinus namaycush]